jgi:DNA ligase-1
MILISKDSKAKVRVVDIEYKFTNPIYIISRNTGLFGGKMIQQPNIEVTRGKVKRTLLQQAELEYNSLVKRYLDKGYQKYDELTRIPITQITSEQISNLIANEKTNQNGIIKPMLAKDHNKCATNIFENNWVISRKIDGVRALFSWDGEQVIVTSRGGGNYNASTTHLRNDIRLREFFTIYPNIILDGELYKHGLLLQQISGIARLTENSERTEQLEFWIYDLIDLENLQATFEDRMVVLSDLDINYHFGSDFNPYGIDKIKLVPHKLISGFAVIDLHHDRYIKEGFEGVILRDPKKEYGVGKRDNRMIKYKKYDDDEFEITGYEEGLRDEDFVFTCITQHGKTFSAKPIGSRELKSDYRNNMNNIIGKKATVKFFYYSEDGIPLQPVLKSIREYGE